MEHNWAINQKTIFKFIQEINSELGRRGSNISVLLRKETHKIIPKNDSIAFDTKVYDIFMSGVNWSPSKLFFDLVKKHLKKHFNLGADKIFWNNTGQIFWFYAPAAIVAPEID